MNEGYLHPTALQRLREKTIQTHTGVTCGFINNFFLETKFQDLIRTFPELRNFKFVDKADSGGGHKRFYVGPEYVITRNFGSVFHLRNLEKPWRNLLEELSSVEFIQKLSESTGIKFNTLCNFGIGYGDEGCMQEPHLDGAIREGDSSLIKGNIALLIYLNDQEDPISATEIYDLDRKTILLKGTTMRNSILFFKQHKNAWHGFPRVPTGHTRRIISLTYAEAPKPVGLDWSSLGYVKSTILKKIDRTRIFI
jgi:hypothetical protein